MSDGFELASGEREILRAPRGGTAGYGAFAGCFFIFLGMQALGLLVLIPVVILDHGEGWQHVLSTLAFVGVAAAVWFWHRKKPACIVTNQRFVVPRLLRAPLSIDPRDVASAARFTVIYTRYGRTVGTNVTHRIVVSFRSGGHHRFGPVLHVDEIVGMLNGVANGFIDLRALPGASGEPARAEERGDLFLATASTAGDEARGPVFVGPTKVIAWRTPLTTMRRYQLLTIVGAEHAPAQIEDVLVDLAGNTEWGQSVVMDREGRELQVEKSQLRLASGEHAVTFRLAEADAARARRYAGAGHAYR